MADRPYSRVYSSIVDDPKFEAIYANDHHLATWLRLLLIADGCYPASAQLPATARPASIKALQDVALIHVRPGGMYRIHGLDKERTERTTLARASAYARWSDRNATAMRPQSDTYARRDETRQDEQTREHRHSFWGYPVRRCDCGEERPA